MVLAAVVPVEFVVVVAAALAVAAAAADLARKAVGTLRKTQVEERCDVAAAAVFVVVVAAAVVVVVAVVVAVSEDMVVAAEHAMSWAWAFANLHLVGVLQGNYCFGYYSSYGAAYGTPSSFGDQLGLVRPCPDVVASCWSGACARTCRDASAFVAAAAAVSVGPSS